MHDKFNKLKKPTKLISGYSSPTLKQDMSYSVGMDTNSSSYRAFRDQLDCVLDLDQLSAQRRRGRVFKGFEEGPINFPPSYKYDKRSNQFDTSAKARCPAWTDRILYSMRSAERNAAHQPILRLRNYLSLDIRSSDHRPVVARFNMNV